MWDFLSIIPISILVILFLIFMFTFYSNYIINLKNEIKLDASISNLNYFIMKNSIYSNLKIPGDYRTKYGIEVNGKIFGNKSKIIIEFPEIVNGKTVEVKGYA